MCEFSGDTFAWFVKSHLEGIPMDCAIVFANPAELQLR